VLYLLHGSPGAARDWLVAGQANTSADMLIATGSIPELIMVMPDGNGLPGMTSEWADSFNHTQFIETSISKELVSYVDQHYRTLADAQHRAIGGLSMGGFGAMNIAIHHPDVFHSVMSFGGYYQAAGAVWGNNAAYKQANSPLITIRQNRAAQKLHIYLGAASQDQPYYNDTRQFAHTLDTLHITYVLDVLPGHHAWHVWQTQLYHALLWLHWSAYPSLCRRAIPGISKV
jgi:S-formylglutathione hydrolase FrmB